jgi:putative restriction endonuclease
MSPSHSSPPSSHYPRAWKLQAFGSQRQYQGNRGYEDDPSSVYRFDSSVPNHQQVRVGDIVFIEDHKGLIGIARIERVLQSPGMKDRQRCPVCRTTAIKVRKHKYPGFRCNVGHEFERPDVEGVECITFEAWFGNTFVPAHGAISAASLRKAAGNNSLQQSIRPIHLWMIAEELARAVPESRHLIATASYPNARDAGAAEKNDDAYAAYNLDDDDTRSTALQQMRIRRGQRTFRDALIERYEGRCLITGCELLDVVQAAHIDPYRGDRSNHPENGLLLRSDLHDLFDLDLLGIHPEQLTVHLASPARNVGYDRLQGKTLRCRPDVRPSREALARRWSDFQNRLAHRDESTSK